MPSFLIFKDGKEILVDRVKGANVRALEDMLAKYASKKDGKQSEEDEHKSAEITEREVVVEEENRSDKQQPMHAGPPDAKLSQPSRPG